MKIQEIREIIKLMDQSSLDEFVFEADGTKLKLKKHGVGTGTTQKVVEQPSQVTAAVEASTPAVSQTSVVEEKEVAAPEQKEQNNYKTITSPMVGTFYESSSPDAAAYVKVGDKVSASSVVCIVEAMKLFNEIEAEIDGEIVEILVKDGQLVEYGQPLFSIK
ncbi:acetyl-CoA carboxylase biotin carboxyl carrier protein [Chryseomicrobium sp. FSL W7-1435]|uniref:acetyl-CoA carboxylase biotin carboxyl carrier protein n=1 Tax=Chryseomicrobium sp. FSL W7-1435 TaxID=2921704 RepID=UPI003159E866